MDGRILRVTARQLMLLRANLEAKGASHKDLPRADRVLDKLYREGEPDDTPVEVALTNDDYDFIRRLWESNDNFLMHRELRKQLLKISDALREAPGFNIQASESGMTVERERVSTDDNRHGSATSG